MGQSIAGKWESEYNTMKEHDNKAYLETMGRRIGFSLNLNNTLNIELKSKSFMFDNEIREYKRRDLKDVVDWKFKILIREFLNYRKNCLKLKQISNQYNILIQNVNEKLKPIIYANPAYKSFHKTLKILVSSGSITFDTNSESSEYVEAMVDELDILRTVIERTESVYEHQKFEVKKLGNYSLYSSEDLKLWYGKIKKMNEATDNLLFDSNVTEEEKTKILSSLKEEFNQEIKNCVESRAKKTLSNYFEFMKEKKLTACIAGNMFSVGEYQWAPNDDDYDGFDDD